MSSTNDAAAGRLPAAPHSRIRCGHSPAKAEPYGFSSGGGLGSISPPGNIERIWWLHESFADRRIGRRDSFDSAKSAQRPTGLGLSGLGSTFPEGDAAGICLAEIHAHPAPVVSGRPNMTFMFCTAAPLAPLAKLSIAQISTTRSPGITDRHLDVVGTRDMLGRRQVLDGHDERVRLVFRFPTLHDLFGGRVLAADVNRRQDASVHRRQMRCEQDAGVGFSLMRSTRSSISG